jgi:hypothetical protein
MSKLFVAFPDNDYLDHVNFSPYIVNFLSREIMQFQSNFGLVDESINEIIEGIGEVDVLESSCSTLIQFYIGQKRLTMKQKRILWSNIEMFLLGSKTSIENFTFGVLSKRKIYLMFVLFSVAVLHIPLLIFRRRKKQLMDEGF